MDSYQTTRFLEKKHHNLIYIGLILLVGLLLFIRASYGFDWCDEGYYYSITYRLALGDRMFSDSWELHQTSAVVTLPLMKLFLHLNGGSTEGMVLLFRRIFVLFEVWKKRPRAGAAFRKRRERNYSKSRRKVRTSSTRLSPLMQPTIQ